MGRSCSGPHCACVQPLRVPLGRARVGVRPLAPGRGCAAQGACGHVLLFGFVQTRLKQLGSQALRRVSPSMLVERGSRCRDLGSCWLPGVPGKAGVQASQEMGSETRNRLRWELLELLKILHSGSCFPLVSSFISRQEMCMSGQGLMTDRFRLVPGTSLNCESLHWLFINVS